MAITSIPTNTSLLQTTKYTFIIPDKPFLRYFCQTVNMPGVSTSPVEIPTPFSPTFRHGDTLRYDALAINAIIDEDFRVWEETYKWLVSLTTPTQFSEYAKHPTRRSELYFDGVLTLNNNSNVPNMRIKFFHCHPISLGSVNFTTMDSADVIPTADIVFQFDRLEVVRD